MEKLIAVLAEKGFNITADMDEEQILKVAKAVGVEPLDYIERQVKIVPYTNRRGMAYRFVETPPFVVGKSVDGKTRTTRGLFLRVEALDQAIADLTSARELLSTKD